MLAGVTILGWEGTVALVWPRVGVLTGPSLCGGRGAGQRHSLGASVGLCGPPFLPKTSWPGRG